MKTRRTAFALAVVLLLAGTSAAQEDRVMVVTEALTLPTINSYVRSSLYIDPVEGDLITGSWNVPRVGDEVRVLGETVRWEAIEADSAGWFQHRHLRGGYVYATVQSDREQVVLLETLGNKWAYVNGEPRVGNRYQGKDSFEDWEPRFDFHRVPVLLRRGTNEVLVKCNRGRLKIRLHPVERPVSLNPADVTLPDIRTDDAETMWGAIVLVNATTDPIDGLRIETSLPGEATVQTAVASLPPLSVFKAPFRIRADGRGKSAGDLDLTLRLQDANGSTLDAATLPVAVRDGAEQHRRTYRSSVDGSVQYYAVKPATEPGRQALVLSVHGANVEAWNQASSYSAKSWTHIVAPTNRRAYGYNWEDWGRIDAIEVLERAQSELQVDPERVYLTGHSMGGHGTWYLGSTYPDRFAAIAPSAGYLRVGAYYTSYYQDRGLRNMPVLDRAKNVSFTDSLLTNLTGLGVYVLHGSDDRSVTTAEARRALDILATFHTDYRYHEEPGVGHWWDRSDEPGSDAVDWRPIFDLFARRARPGIERVRTIDFTTADPGVSATSYWATIYRQQQPLEFSRIRLHLDPGRNRIAGTTRNVSLLALETSVLDRARPAVLRIDGDSLTVDWGLQPLDGPLYLSKAAGGWRLAPAPSAQHKGPHRYAGFKAALSRNVLFVYGTDGTAEENRWALDKARFDAETFWYQGNGSIEVIPDRAFDPSRHADRNVTLYGNATTNRAWSALLDGSPIQVARDRVDFGDEVIRGRDHAVLFVRPRAGSDSLLVGVVGGAGASGMRLTNTLPYLYQNFAVPDVLVYGPDVIGDAEPEAVLTGYFGSDWGIETGEWVRGEASNSP